MKICKNCAHEIEDTATICRNCGCYSEAKNTSLIDDRKVQEKDDEKEFMNHGFMRGPYNKWIAILLCIFLGWLGGHKFYEGKYIMGFLYVLTLGFWGIGIILDLVNLIFKKKYYYISSIPFIRV